jgi:hypothetical protein
MYFEKISEMDIALASALDDFSNSNEYGINVDSTLARIERLQSMIQKAKLCNRVLEQIREDADDGDVSVVVRRVLDNNELSVEQMGVILLFAPQWSKTLIQDGTISSLKSASLYQVEFLRKSDGAVFYKVGHTGRPLTTRLSGFKYDKRKYSAHVHHQILFAKKHVAAAEEARLHLANMALRYDGEPFLTNGHTEVYTEPLISQKLRLEIALYALLGISRD